LTYTINHLNKLHGNRTTLTHGQRQA
jgi:hypothetical protein